MMRVSVTHKGEIMSEKIIEMHQIGGTLKQELHRTAQMVVELSADLGVYFAVALLLDSEYDRDRIRALLPILEKTRGAIKKKG